MSVKDLGLSPEDNREPHMGAEQGGWGYTAYLAEPKPVKAHHESPKPGLDRQQQQQRLGIRENANPPAASQAC